MHIDMSMLLIAISTAVVSVVGCVGMHLATLVTLSRTLDRWFSHAHWRAIGCLVLIAISAHLLEMGVFAVGIRVLELWHDGGSITHRAAFDAWYRSAVAYTSMGDETEPIAGVRLLLAVEALTGLILIAWTASFLFVVMERTWQDKLRRDDKRR